MSPSRPRLLLFGNCQSEWLDDSLNRNAALTERYEVVHIASNYTTPKTALLQQPEFLATCAFVAWQTAAGSLPPKFVANLPSSCRQIRYPTLCLKLLWPLHARDPRNQSEAGFPNGRFPYGDRLLVKLLEEQVPVRDLYRRYVDTDLNTIVNLDRFSTMALAELQFNDRQSDIAVAPLIEGTYRQRRTFAAINHPTLWLLNHVSRSIAAIALEQAAPAAPLEFPEANQILGDQEIPLHPQVISHFKLKWASAHLKYDYGAELLSLEQYVRAYGEYRAIPFGVLAEGWFARAQRAVNAHNLIKAACIIRQAARVFPDNPLFPYFLGTSLAKHGQLEAAREVLAGAARRHPRVAAIYFELGRVLLRLRQPETARQMFMITLQLDPNHPEACRALQAIGQSAGTPLVAVAP